MSPPSRPLWSPTNDEFLDLATGFVGLVTTAFGAPYLAPFGALAFRYAFRQRDRIFASRADVIVPTLAWNALDRPVAGPAGDEPAAYDLLSLLSRRFREQRITVTPRLTPEARASGLSIGDPVPLAFAGRGSKSQSGLIVPAQVGRPVTVTLPRSDYALLAYGSPSEKLFRARDPYLAIATARLASERRSAVDVPLYPRVGHGPLTFRGIASPAEQLRVGVPCLYCGKQFLGNVFFNHMLECPQRPGSGLRSSALRPAAAPRLPASVPGPQTRRTPRAEFISHITSNGFWLGPGAKHLYYHDNAPYPSRIVLQPRRIRFEVCSKMTMGKYELWQSYSLDDEIDLALKALPELKSKSRRRLRG